MHKKREERKKRSVKMLEKSGGLRYNDRDKVKI